MSNLNSGMPWGKLVDEGPASSPTLLEYGLMTLLSSDGEVDFNYPHWGYTRFQCSAEIWGVEFTWPKNLEAQVEYIFIFKFEQIPDVILLNGAMVWKRLQNEAPNGKVLFRYISEEPQAATLSFIRHTRYSAGRNSAGLIFSPHAACYRQGAAKKIPPHYPRADWYGKLKKHTPPALFHNTPYDTAPLFALPNAPLPVLNSNGMAVEIYHETIEAYLPRAAARQQEISAQQEQFLLDLIVILEQQSIDGLALYHLTPKLLHALRNSRIRRFIVTVGSLGDHWLCRNGNYIQRHHYETGIAMVNQLLDAMPDAQVTVWFPEVEDREYNYFQSPDFDEYRRAEEECAAIFGTSSYNDFSDNEFWRESCLNFQHRQWKTQMWKRFSDPRRVVAAYQSANPFAIAHFKASGSDLTVSKAIFRDNFNVVLASARGTARVHNQPMGLDYDPWSWQVRMNHTPEEWLQGLMLYLHGGCQFLFHEGTLFRRDPTDGCLKANACGLAFLQAVRYARCHPPVGETVVKIAAMHGSGDCDPVIQPRFKPQLPMDETPADWVAMRYQDYGLLDVFFPKLGGYMSGNLQRLMTGTPYGPVDIVPYDARYEHLKAYQLLFILGSNGCDEAQKAALEEFVRNGGILIFALGQLRGKSRNPRRLIASDFVKLAGVRVDLDTEELTVVDAELLAEYPGEIKLLHHEYGLGQSYCVSSGTLSCCAQNSIRELLHDWGRKLMWVKFIPGNDFLEWIPGRCGLHTLSLTLFHHGRIGFPGGLGPRQAPWHGSVEINRNELYFGEDLAVKLVQTDFTLQELPFTLQGDVLVLELTVDRVCELVIGRAGDLQNDWLHPENEHRN